jgi:hypothetical protein
MMPVILRPEREIFEKLGQRDKAIADYRQSLLLDASMKRALEGLKRLDVN